MSGIQIHNSLVRAKQELIPIIEGEVRMYVCGMTVYDYCHIGHARAMVVFDMVVRYLRYRGLKVTFVRNITDIDDKIIKRAQERGQDINELTAFFIDAMHEDEAMLGVLLPDVEPRATGHMPQMLTMIDRLVDKDFAYQADNRDVYYRVRRFKQYGRLSGESVDELRSGTRIEPGQGKDDPLDFVLWKHAKPGEPSWDSPWGPGRPGWHIECSAMSTHSLGAHFDIHGGGLDLRFPHHENEIAQSEAATGEPFANLWMHNGHVRIDEEKMSKSLGNFFTIREVLDQDLNRPRMGEVIRFMILSSHYRSPLNFSPGVLDDAKAGLTRMYLALDQADKLLGQAAADAPLDGGDSRSRFGEAMDDDFNTPEALAVLFDVVRVLNRAVAENQLARVSEGVVVLRDLGGVLGLLQQRPAVFLGSSAGPNQGLPGEEIESLIHQRNAARERRDFTGADRIRDELDQQGVILEDGPDGTRWRRR